MRGERSDHLRVTPAQIAERLTYEPETGLLRWKKTRYTAEGREAGYRGKNYIEVRVCTAMVLGHRVAWVLMTGGFPPPDKMIDHINRIKHDNRWTNLRLVDDTVNVINRDLGSDCGISLCQQTGKWKAYITLNYRQKWLGRFETKEAALAARLAAEKDCRGALSPRSAA